MKNWYYLHGDRQVGPVTSTALKQLATTAQLAPNDKVRMEDQAHWHDAKAVSGLFQSEHLTSPGAKQDPFTNPQFLQDYYLILKVAPNARLKQIQNAYVRRAEECHPERGGSDDAMRALIVAWRIMTNPETRVRYDLARARPADKRARAKTLIDIEEVTEESAAYPQSWESFIESNYYATRRYLGQTISYADTSNPEGMIALGGGLGLLAAIGLLSATHDGPWTAFAIRCAIGLLSGCTLSGASMGMWFHKRLRHRRSRRENKNSS